MGTLGLDAWLSPCLGRSAALRQVQLDMLAQGQRSHLYYWASFIVSGDPAPLPGVGGATRGAPDHPGTVRPSRGCACDP